MKDLKPGTYEVKFHIAQDLADKTGIPKEKCAEFITDEIIKGIEWLYGLSASAKDLRKLLTEKNNENLRQQLN